jgi:hypothetical protein
MHDPPPPLIGSDRVLAYAIISPSMIFTGRTIIYVDGKLLGPVPRLALCQDGDGPGVVLYHCDEIWEVFAVSGGGSPHEIKERAERAYVGLAGEWCASPYTPQDVAQFSERQEPVPVCSSCQKAASEVERIIVKEDGGPAICNVCIDLLHREIHIERRD